MPAALPPAPVVGERPPSAAVLVAALLVAALCLGAKISRIVPPEPQPPLQVNGERVSLAVGGVEVSLELLDPEERVQFLGERGADLGMDPFAPDPAGRTRFTTFRLDLVNRTREEVNLHPASLRAVADDIPHFALEYTAFYEHFASRRRLDPAHLETLQKATFVETIVVPAGGRASGLIVFRDLPLRFKRFKILGGSVLVGADSKSFLIPFGVVQEKVRRKDRERPSGPGAGIDPARGLGDRKWR